MQKQIIIIFGPQGSGKGTQAKILAKELNLPHISTGDLFRAIIDEGGELSKQVEMINQGQLVADELAFKVLQERISQTDCVNGFILDGYPRTLPQAKLLDNKVNVSKIIEINISEAESLKRLVNRRQDPETGKIYNLYTAPKPTPEIEPRLIQREDDKEEAIKKRLATYYQNTKLLLEYYQAKVIKINGEQDIDKVAQDIVKSIK